jgi:tetratricopeptide (TPR) repeat protein
MSACKWWGVALTLNGAFWANGVRAQDPVPTSPPAAPLPAKPSTEACAAPSPTDIEAAKNAYRSGQTAFSEGDYERAGTLWSDAYEHDCTAHALLLNLATAYELLGRPDRAVDALRRFDERVPDSPYIEANTKRMERLQRIPVQRPRAHRDDVPCPAPVAPPVHESHSGEVIVPLALAVGGGAASLLGGVLYVQARYAEGSAAEHCGAATGQCTDLNSVIDGERARAHAQTAGWVTGAGLLTLATGLVWYFVTPTSHDEQVRAADLHADSQLGKNSFGVSLRGGF